MSATLTAGVSEQRRLPKGAALSDALVFFGATGDLAYKQIFPSLQQMIRRGNLNVPVIGVARPAGRSSSLGSGHTTAWRSTVA